MNRILVAGGAGFVGSHLCERLLKTQDNIVYCVDNLSTGSKRNVSHLLDNPNFNFIFHDTTDPITLLVDQIYNLASPASPPQYQKNPIFTLKTNFLGSMNLLELAHKNKARILQASTSEVYGDPLEHPQKESYWGNVNPIGIRSCYDEGKRCAETLFFDYHRNFGVDIRVIRIFNTYGPRMDRFDGRVVSNFINQILNNNDITIYGDGNQTRSFQYVDDLIDGMMLVMNGCDTGPFNIGNPVEFNMIQLATLVKEKIPYSTSKIVFENLPKDDPKMRKPNISLMNDKYSWTPKVSIGEGLDKTIDYFKGLSS
jgi:UDP-glucuronate decarboxylase